MEELPEPAPSIAHEEVTEARRLDLWGDEGAAYLAFDPYRLAAVDSPTSREAMELEDLTGVPLN
jgi:hypothetical protein